MSEAIEIPVEQTNTLVSDTTVRVSPFLKWAGGKSHLQHQLLPLIPDNLINYYEPFLGGGALFFALCNRGTSFKAFLSDTNTELISTYKVVKESPKELIEYLSRFDRHYSSAIEKESYYSNIKNLKTIDEVQAAAKFVFLNKTCYNGLYRVNKHGQFNVPFGDYEDPLIYKERNIKAASQALQDTSAQLTSSDYTEIIKECKRGDFVYFDPPYYPLSKTAGFTDYTAEGFTEDDQKTLSEQFGALVNRGCIVLLTNSDTPEVRALYDKYQLRSVEVSRSISCIGSKRRGFRDLIVYADGCKNRA